MTAKPSNFRELIETVTQIINESRGQLVKMENSRDQNATHIARKRAAMEKIEAELRLIQSAKS